MIQIIALMFITFTFINFIISGYDLLNPGVIFNIMFGLYSIVCCITDAIVPLEIHNLKTLGVFFLGSTVFTLINYSSIKSSPKRLLENQLYAIDVKPVIQFAFLAIVVLAGLLMYRYINQFEALYNVHGSFSVKLNHYDTITKFNTNVKLPMPSYVSLCNQLARSICHVSLYILLNNWFAEKRFYKLYAVVIMCYFVSSLMGGRTEALRVITSILLIWYVYYRKTHGWKKGNVKIYNRLLLIGVAIVIVFSALRGVLGRNTYSVIKVVFGYLGAPLKNFDTFLTNPHKSINGIWGAMTFAKFINWIGKRTNNQNLIYTFDQPFLYYKDFRMGNVYTTYYSFYYDFGTVGCIVLIAIMSLYYCFTYRKIQRKRIRKSKISLQLLFYAYLFNDLIMVPFSSRFYETVVNINFIRFSIMTIAIVWYVNNRRRIKLKY